MTVGILLVSHSDALARGLRDLAAQMARDVTIVAAGGDDDGGLGTSFDRVSSGLSEADQGDGVVVLYDLGSALLTTETALELVDPQTAERVRVLEAPMVEGAIAAAVAAQAGSDLDAVTAAVQATASAGAEPEAAPGTEDQPEAEERREVELVNPLGLHARPAATLAQTVGRSSAHAFVARPGARRVDLTSVLSVVGQALRGGDRVELTTSGPGAAALLDELSELIAGGFGESDRSVSLRPSRAARREGDLIRATPGSPGLALAPVRRLKGYPSHVRARPIRAFDAVPEVEQLTRAVTAAAEQLSLGGPILQAHAAIVRDPQLLSAATARLQEGAASAWWGAVQGLAGTLERSGDEFVQARAADVRDAGAAVLQQLGVRLSRVGDDVEGAVVVADDLGPAEVSALVENGCAAVILAKGSPTAHAVIVARALDLPMVIRAGDSLDDVDAGTEVALDGSVGTIQIAPDPQESAELMARLEEHRALATRLREAAAEPVEVNGRPVLVAANIGSVADAEQAIRSGADAVGLFRTELLLLNRDAVPDEDQQVADLREVLDVVRDIPVTVRVLDVGGDKPTDALDLDPVHHGFLGVRGLRYLLENEDLLHTQLRAICRASIGMDVSVMAPMVTTVEEARAFRAAVDRAVESLLTEGAAHQAPRMLGVMVEIPAAALTIDQFAGVVDFVSIGTNDLLSYTVAAERTEPAVAYLLDDHSPALTRLLDRAIRDASEVDVPVAVCGELAGHPGHAVRLVQEGVGELSMSPNRIPAIKAALRELDQTG